MNNTIDSNPYKSPKAAVGIDQSDSYKPKIFTTQGRIGRLRYFAYSMIFNLIAMFLLGIVSAILIPLLTNSGGQGGIGIFIPLLIYIPLFAIFFIVAKRRLNDLDRTGWMALLVFVPIINALFSLYLLFWPGSAGANKYGPRPESNNAIEIIMGIIGPLIIIAILAAISIPAYQNYVEKAKQAQMQMQK